MKKFPSNLLQIEFEVCTLSYGTLCFLCGHAYFELGHKYKWKLTLSVA